MVSAVAVWGQFLSGNQQFKRVSLRTSTDTVLGMKIDHAIKALETYIGKLKSGSVSVGFMEDANYPDGTPVAMVAFDNEFGKPANHQPPRPFFRRMIAEKSPGWSLLMRNSINYTHFNIETALGLVGEQIKGDLQESINTLTEPKLAAYTIAKKGFDKPLIETKTMLNAVDYTVDV